MEHQYIIAHADKTVLKISGLQVKGLNTRELEQILSDKIHSLVRVIGVTGDSVEMDIYEAEPEQIRKDAQGVIRAVALAEGITATELTQMVCSEKILEVDYNLIPDQPVSGCAKEKWMKRP
ncbi:MAG: hypothetical protein VB085_07190 [Peptococcaceae bacterium]|nr:hypothetical protein [Peptococcaceae bacterium]